MGRTIKIFGLISLLSVASSQAFTFRRLVIRACQRLNNVRADMAFSRLEKAQCAAGITALGLGLNGLESAYRTSQEKQIRAGLEKMANRSGAVKKIKLSGKK